MTFPVPLLLGHRGSSGQARENTIESFRRALEAGLDGLELDLHRTRDGVLVVYHDFDLAGQPIAEMEWPLLQQQAPWMPRIEQVLELAEEFPAWLNLELKSQPGPSDGRETLLAQVLRAWSGRERAWISSFDPLALPESMSRWPCFMPRLKWRNWCPVCRCRGCTHTLRS